MSQTPPDVHLYIRRLVVDEALLAHGQGRKLEAGVQAELTRLLTEHGLGTSIQGVTLPGLDAPAIQVGPVPATGMLAEQVARSVYTSLGRLE